MLERRDQTTAAQKEGDRESETNQMTRRRLLQVGATVLSAPALAAILSACGGEDSGEGANTADTGAGTGADAIQTPSAGTLTMAYGSTPGQVDPTNFSGNDMEYTTGNCYATPVRFIQVENPEGFTQVDAKDPQIEGWLAESLESSADLKTFRLTLRENQRSFFGNTLTTEDVRWTIERNIQTPGNGSIIVSLAGMTSPANISVIDDQVIELKPDEPNRLLPLLLQNMFGFGIVDSTEAKKHVTGDDQYAGQWLARNTAGFGPYQMQSLSPQEADFVVNPNYEGPRPVYDPVKWLAVPEAANRFSLIQSGDLDIITDLEPQQINDLQGSSNLTLYSTGIEGTFDSLQYNSTVPELKDPQVRQALTYAIPFDGILEAVYKGTAQKWESVIGGTPYAYADAGLNPYSTDPARAKELLSAAGADNLAVKINFDTTSFWQEAVAIQLQTAWRDIGVTVDLEGLVPAVWGEKLGTKEMPVFFVTLGSLVPDAFYEMSLWYLSTSGLNFSGYNNSEVDSVLQQGLATSDPTEQANLAQQAQELIFADVPVVSVGVRDRTTVMDSAISGYSAWMNGMVYWAGLSPTS